jgi:hypothetical protein
LALAWWCGSCGGPLDPEVLIVRVGATSRGPAAHSYCGEACATRGPRPSAVGGATWRSVGPRQPPSPDRSVLDEICRVD